MCLSLELVKFCVCPSFPFGIESGMLDVIVLIPDHCLSIYFDELFVGPARAMMLGTFQCRYNKVK